jgi:hypothetical protein
MVPDDERAEHRHRIREPVVLVDHDVVHLAHVGRSHGLGGDRRRLSVLLVPLLLERHVAPVSFSVLRGQPNLAIVVMDPARHVQRSCTSGDRRGVSEPRCRNESMRRAEEAGDSQQEDGLHRS